MAKANVILLNSILWNLREVTKLADKIKEHCGDVDCTSWRYPLTSCSELEIFKLLQNNRNLDSYTYILELTYDRLLYVFNLMIKYMESTDSLERFRPGKNIYRPKTLSLAAVLHMIWERMKARCEHFGNKFEGKEEVHGAVELKVSKSSTCTQSEVSSISKCSCCEMVQDFVSQLVLEMEKILEDDYFESAISKERKEMKDNLIDMTNWSAMSRWLAAILKDFATITEKAIQETSSSRKLKLKIESEELALKSKMELYEDESLKLQSRLKELETRLQEMRKEINKLTKEKSQMNKEIRIKNTELEIKESKMLEMKKMFETKLEKKTEKNLKKEKEKEKEWNLKLTKEVRKNEELEKKKGELSETIDKLRDDVVKLNLKLEDDKNNFLNKCKNLEMELEILKLEKQNLNLIINDKQKTIDEYAARIMDAFPELNAKSKTTYKATGNPVTDMENQIEANKLRMELLTSENEKLKKTLEKLKAIKG